MRILFLSSWFPYPPDNGSKLRAFNVLRGLAGKHRVSLITFTDRQVPDTPPELAEICEKVRVVPGREYNPNSFRSVIGLFSQKPRVVVGTFSTAMEQAIRDELRESHFDLVIASEWPTAAYLESVTGVQALFEELEVGNFESKSATASSPFLKLRHDLTRIKLRRYLRRLLPRFARCIVVSDGEAALLRRMAPGYGEVEVIPNAVDVSSYDAVERIPEPNSLIFTGSFRYYSNYEAMIWFLGQAYRVIQSEVPGVQLTITGDHADLPLPSSVGVRLTGRVEDARPLIASAWASLAPIRQGGGTRMKILEAMALGTPVVSTTKGAEGLDVRHEDHLLIADTPEEYAGAVIRLLRDASLRERLAASAHSLVREKYDWNAVMARYLEVVEKAALPRPHRHQRPASQILIKR